MGGKLCIHPKQLASVHESFAPTAAERDWAARVVEAMGTAQGAATMVDGKMVDRPVWLKALRLHQAPEAGARMRV
jgi:citrate lyase subunit beta/citryl-CoA lyase